MQFLEYDTDKNIRAFSTLRGEGSGNYGGFNITNYCGDTPEHVKECRKELCKKLSIEDNRLILPRQTHSNEILHIDNEFINRSMEERTRLLYGIDAVITNIPQTCIGVSTADCVPILMYDNVKGIVAAVHAGWRGTVAHIVKKCVDEIAECYNSRPENIKAIIGPSISIDAFEIGEEVYVKFSSSNFPMERIARRYPTDNGGEKWHIDLCEANRLQMIGAGMKAENISIAGICTYKKHKDFFSARRIGINSGRIFNGIMKER